MHLHISMNEYHQGNRELLTKTWDRFACSCCSVVECSIFALYALSIFVIKDKWLKAFCTFLSFDALLAKLDIAVEACTDTRSGFFSCVEAVRTDCYAFIFEDVAPQKVTCFAFNASDMKTA